MAGVTVQEVRTGVDRLIGQVGHWSERRWRGHGDTVAALAQHLADLAADTEGQPRRPVPRLSDALLPDQLRVIVADLLSAGPDPDALADARDAIAATRRTLDG